MPALTGLLLLALAPASVERVDDTAVLREINRLRTAPSVYAAGLRREAAGYHGRYRGAGSGLVASFEGAVPVREAAAALEAQRALPPLVADPILQAAAREHVANQGRDGGIGHIGSAGDSPGERARRHGGDIYLAEVISYGARSAAEVVRQLVVDDGVAGRGHRQLLLTPFYRYAGIWCGPHAGRDTMCVIDLAAGPGGRPHVPEQ